MRYASLHYRTPILIHSKGVSPAHSSYSFIRDYLHVGRLGQLLPCSSFYSTHCAAIDLSRAAAIRALVGDQAHLEQERESFRAKQRSYEGYSRERMTNMRTDEQPGRSGVSLRRSVRFVWGRRSVQS